MSTSQNAPGASARTILLAHDQQESPEARKHFLELAGFTVELVKSHAELMARLSSSSPALAVIDVLLEGKTGFDATREIRERTKRHPFPIVLCSQIYRLRTFRDEALRCGAQEYLLLPLPPDEFVRRIQHVLASFARPAGQSAAA
jgi:CheY-like chemotaxis protein